MNFFIAGNERQTRDSGLRNNQTIIGIPKSGKRLSFEKQLDVVHAKIKVICLGKRNDEIPKRQRKANLTGLGKKHYFLKRRKWDNHRIDSSLHLFKCPSGFRTKFFPSAHNVMD